MNHKVTSDMEHAEMLRICCYYYCRTVLTADE